MGNQKQKWTSEEEKALKAGVAKHGTGKWKNILRDPEFGPSLTSRSNIDLKDKWRNLNGNVSAQGSGEKSRASRGRATATGAENDAICDPCKSSQENRNVPRYSEMIFEALSSIKDPNGSDIGAIAGFIEQRYEVPPNFRRLLSSKMRRLVLQGKVEKVQKCNYMIKDVPVGTRTPSPKKKEVRPRPTQSLTLNMYSKTLLDAAMYAAYRMAEAENKSFLAAEAVKEAERVSKLSEVAESMLQFVTEIYDQCMEGEVVLLA
nr:telomere repeat-binding factor 4-like [Ipomoea batatas]